MLLNQRQDAQDAAHCGLAVFLMHAAAERPDLGAGFVGAWTVVAGWSAE